MFKVNFNWRKVAMIACLAVFSFCANSVLAQTVSYTDASGVTCTYVYSASGYEHADLTEITNFPSSVTKWVIPEYITFSNGTFPLGDFTADGYADNAQYELPVNNTLREVVFPRQLKHTATAIFSARPAIDGGKFTNIRKVTFGEMLNSVPAFNENPLDSVIFLGSECFYGDDNTFGGNWVFINCPATTKVIVPCGTLAKFVNSFNAAPDWWQHPSGITWTTANFYEAECLNTLTVLSSDVSLGNAISQNGSGQMLTTTTPNNTSVEFSGTATLYALPKAGKVFTGWSDGNTDNPRTVNVAADVTLTANFAACNDVSGIQNVSANTPSLQIFPNPVKDLLHIDVGAYNIRPNETVQVVDFSGRTVETLHCNVSTNGETTINVSALPSGVYFVKIGKYTGKFIKE